MLWYKKLLSWLKKTFSVSVSFLLINHHLSLLLLNWSTFNLKLNLFVLIFHIIIQKLKFLRSKRVKLKHKLLHSKHPCQYFIWKMRPWVISFWISTNQVRQNKVKSLNRIILYHLFNFKFSNLLPINIVFFVKIYACLKISNIHAFNIMR